MSSGRLIIAVIIALMAIVTYFSSTSENPLTGEKQRVAMSPEQEIALGYKSAPEMAAQMGGLSQNEKAQALVKQLAKLPPVVREAGLRTAPSGVATWCYETARAISRFPCPIAERKTRSEPSRMRYKSSKTR